MVLDTSKWLYFMNQVIMHIFFRLFTRRMPQNKYAITTHDSKVCHFWVTIEDLPLSDHLLLCKWIDLWVILQPESRTFLTLKSCSSCPGWQWKQGSLNSNSTVLQSFLQGSLFHNLSSPLQFQWDEIYGSFCVANGRNGTRAVSQGNEVTNRVDTPGMTHNVLDTWLPQRYIPHCNTA